AGSSTTLSSSSSISKLALAASGTSRSNTTVLLNFVSSAVFGSGTSTLATVVSSKLTTLVAFTAGRGAPELKPVAIKVTDTSSSRESSWHRPQMISVSLLEACWTKLMISDTSSMVTSFVPEEIYSN